MTLRHQSRWRSFVAIVCLVAVVLLYAPFGVAAWALHTGKCCTADAQCPIHGHHHTQKPTSPEHAMDCGHDMSAMAQCNMSCCQNVDRLAIAPVIFVLPVSITVSDAAISESLTALSAPQDSVNSLEPLSPPPRLPAVAA